MASATSAGVPRVKVRVSNPRRNSAFGAARDPASAARTLASTMAWRKIGTGAVAAGFVRVTSRMVPLSFHDELAPTRAGSSDREAALVTFGRDGGGGAGLAIGSGRGAVFGTAVAGTTAAGVLGFTTAGWRGAVQPAAASAAAHVAIMRALPDIERSISSTA